MITIHIIYAFEPTQVWQRELQLDDALTIKEVIAQSGIYKQFPELLESLNGVGIFGQTKSLDDIVTDGDRVEIYRGLNFDPMESRRRRAAHKKAGILKRKHFKPDRSKRFEYVEHTDKNHKRRKYD